MSDEKTKAVKKRDVKWVAVLWYTHLHFFSLYGLWLLITSAQWMTVFFTIFITSLGCLGVTAGAHRLWAHKTYTARWPLRLFLMLAHTLAGVGPIYEWVLYHRLHHKHYGTDKDPYNHKKGFFYSHWINHLLSPNVEYKQAKIDIDMRDMEADNIIVIQQKLYWLLFLIFGLLLPLNAPLEYWNESIMATLLITGILRLTITLNVSCLVNSALLIWSSLDTKLTTDSISIFVITPSYWPAYHYLVPWDWKIGEFGSYESGCTTFVIKMWRELGWIENMRTTTPEDMREIIHQVGNKELSLEQGLEKLNERSKFNMEIEERIPHH